MEIKLVRAKRNRCHVESDGGREEGKSIRRRIDIAKGETEVVTLRCKDLSYLSRFRGVDPRQGCEQVQSGIRDAGSGVSRRYRQWHQLQAPG